MSKITIFKKLAKYSLPVATMALMSQGVLAHTRLETSTVDEKTKVHNRVNIGHGCPPTTARNPTFGTNVIFPNAVSYTPIIGVDSGSGKIFSTQSASDFYSPLAGIGTFIRIGGPWDAANIKVDAKNNHDGFWAGGKYYDQTVSTPIQVDFNSAAITINPASCARSVTFYVAIADFCNTSVPSTSIKDEEALFWSPIPNFTGVPGQPFSAQNPYSNYDGYEDAGHTITGDGWGSPASLKVVRKSALPEGCTGNGGLGDDVYVYPSAQQINDEMPIWSGIRAGDGVNYWQ